MYLKKVKFILLLVVTVCFSNSNFYATLSLTQEQSYQQSVVEDQNVNAYLARSIAQENTYRRQLAKAEQKYMQMESQQDLDQVPSVDRRSRLAEAEQEYKEMESQQRLDTTQAKTLLDEITRLKKSLSKTLLAASIVYDKKSIAHVLKCRGQEIEFRKKLEKDYLDLRTKGTVSATIRQTFARIGEIKIVMAKQTPKYPDSYKVGGVWKWSEALTKFKANVATSIPDIVKEIAKKDPLITISELTKNFEHLSLAKYCPDNPFDAVSEVSMLEQGILHSIVGKVLKESASITLRSKSQVKKKYLRELHQQSLKLFAYTVLTICSYKNLPQTREKIQNVERSLKQEVYFQTLRHIVSSKIDPGLRLYLLHDYEILLTRLAIRDTLIKKVTQEITETNERMRQPALTASDKHTLCSQQMVRSAGLCQLYQLVHKQETSAARAADNLTKNKTILMLETYRDTNPDGSVGFTPWDNRILHALIERELQHLTDNPQIVMDAATRNSLIAIDTAETTIVSNVSESEEVELTKILNTEINTTFVTGSNKLDMFNSILQQPLVKMTVLLKKQVDEENQKLNKLTQEQEEIKKIIEQTPNLEDRFKKLAKYPLADRESLTWSALQPLTDQQFKQVYSKMGIPDIQCSLANTMPSVRYLQANISQIVTLLAVSAKFCPMVSDILKPIASDLNISITREKACEVFNEILIIIDYVTTFVEVQESIKELSTVLTDFHTIISESTTDTKHNQTFLQNLVNLKNKVDALVAVQDVQGVAMNDIATGLMKKFTAISKLKVLEFKAAEKEIIDAAEKLKDVQEKIKEQPITDFANTTAELIDIELMNALTDVKKHAEAGLKRMGDCKQLLDVLLADYVAVEFLEKLAKKIELTRNLVTDTEATINAISNLKSIKEQEATAIKTLKNAEFALEQVKNKQKKTEPNLPAVAGSPELTTLTNAVEHAKKVKEEATKKVKEVTKELEEKNLNGLMNTVENLKQWVTPTTLDSGTPPTQHGSNTNQHVKHKKSFNEGNSNAVAIVVGVGLIIGIIVYYQSQPTARRTRAPYRIHELSLSPIKNGQKSRKHIKIDLFAILKYLKTYYEAITNSTRFYYKRILEKLVPSR